jgi:arylsulfatase A-like enzyme
MKSLSGRRKILLAAIFAGGILLVLLAAAYRKNAADADPAPVAVLDVLQAGDILKSPVPLAADRLSSASVFPARSKPIESTEAGENPLGLKSKLWTNFNTEEIDALLAPPHSLYSFELDPRLERLTFGIGVAKIAVRGSAGPGSGLPAGVLFRVLLERNSQRKVIFSRFLPAPPPDAARGEEIFKATLSLPQRTSAMRLLLETIGAEGPPAFWVDPVLDTPRRDARRIVLISLDTLRADHLGCYGYGRATSPALDALAKDGATFLNAHAPSPWTLPSHASLFTGLDPAHHGVVCDQNRLNPALPTIPAFLRAHHFACAAFTGGAYMSPVYGFSKGFGLYQETGGSPHGRDAAARAASAAVRWLNGNADRDFFLFLHTYQIHDPYAPPEGREGAFLDPGARWKGLFLHDYLGGFKGYYRNLDPAERANIVDLYDEGIRYTDEALIKTVVEYLKAAGLYEGTTIIVTSDHGEQFGDHGAWEHMNDLYEDVLRIPLIVKFPEQRFANRRIKSLVRLTDIFATIGDVYGLPLDGAATDGASLVSILKRAETAPRSAIASIIGNVNDSHFPAKTALLDGGRYKLIVNGPRMPGDFAFFRDCPPSYPRLELYDLRLDPDERVNLAARLPDIARALEARLNDLAAAPRIGPGFLIELDDETKERIRSLGYAR